MMHDVLVISIFIDIRNYDSWSHDRNHPSPSTNAAFHLQFSSLSGLEKRVKELVMSNYSELTKVYACSGED